MTENENFISDWLKQYLLKKNANFTDKRYETRTKRLMNELLEKPPDIYLRQQVLISNIPFHKQTPGSNMALLYQVLIDFIDYLLK
ncbi:hypothetical protein ACVR1N_02205 [Streptococcus constellatus subsp. pharyngis]|uniref:Uncharacterized protein n=2 Tax=Streptococcus TaxID=1301 RepID=F9P647_STRCV|nr:MULTISPECIES: hypothetical protein [Streptococcus]AZQ41741.1 hypothetical protein EHW89_04405 [Streptococcus periodonticum]EGV09403.1 hypothetical protein HMPREF1042_0942 [Streptococcus constellatus subsp. pharyngis SK1060 = CCUG 46377]OFP93683.1 hypothetical protein HMPREF2963_06185 [Streptococcus sp. HMSC067A03]QRP82129.1 hypothetical protein I6J38_02305 [Streptococcus constellatus]GAD44553.1 hypothetical protein ANG5_1081 [Streptococcus constellatus subsp. pharyngis SK1060 = CCUG 46377]